LGGIGFVEDVGEDEELGLVVEVDLRRGIFGREREEEGEGEGEGEGERWEGC
jgi:hypothetical protein